MCACVCVWSRNCYESLSHPALLGLNLSLVPQVVALCAQRRTTTCPPSSTVNSLLIPVTSSLTLSRYLFPPLHFTCSSGLANKTHFHLGLVWFGFIAALPFLAVAFPPFLACAFLPSFSLLPIHSSRSTLIFGLYLFVFISCCLSQCFLLNFGSDCRALSFFSSLFLCLFFSLFLSFFLHDKLVLRAASVSFSLSGAAGLQSTEQRIDFVKLTTKLVCVLGTKLVLRTFYRSGQDGEWGGTRSGGSSRFEKEPTSFASQRCLLALCVSFYDSFFHPIPQAHKIYDLSQEVLFKFLMGMQKAAAAEVSFYIYN